ncbi:protein of unknown function [Xenorhabdus doucetiae]|uniref:Uncharacterized protein n=1 Tax=Xenorhabdus doucetiae TaxID=351671 RepID=A0A068QRX8_9GAMM|nr:protein of unknown function [Xenorhabdus doucetiae]
MVNSIKVNSMVVIIVVDSKSPFLHNPIELKPNMSGGDDQDFDLAGNNAETHRIRRILHGRT